MKVNSEPWSWNQANSTVLSYNLHDTISIARKSVAFGLAVFTTLTWYTWCGLGRRCLLLIWYTWSGFEAVKPGPRPSRRLHRSY